MVVETDDCGGCTHTVFETQNTQPTLVGIKWHQEQIKMRMVEAVRQVFLCDLMKVVTSAHMSDLLITIKMKYANIGRYCHPKIHYFFPLLRLKI